MNSKTVALGLALVAVMNAPAAASLEASSAFFLKSIISVNTANHTVTLPLHRGMANGKVIWYIVTDASDAGVAKSRGLVFAPDIANLGDEAIANATVVDGIPNFAGAPDFSATRSYVAGATGFPPKTAAPGGIADESYSPFVRIEGTPGVLNAPIVATGTGPFDLTSHSNTEDRVVAIDTVKGTVSLVLARGFFDGKPIYYVSTEASDPVAASVERATYVPRLAKANSSATIPIGVVVDGARSDANVQGLDYLALATPLDKDATLANAASIGSPFNVLSLIPDTSKPFVGNDYSPLWSVSVVGAKQSERLTSYAAIAPISKAAGFVVNCPAIALDTSGGY
jgi:hypothetical protein